MRITKTLCEEIVSKLVEPITAKMKENEAQLSEVVKSAILSECPKEVVKLWEQKSKFITTRSGVNVYYLGQHGYTSFNPSIPWHTSQFNIPIGEVADKVQKLVNNNLTLSKKKHELSIEFETLILKLSTYARITEQFPEAAVYLPSEQKMEIALNIQDTRDKLKYLP